MKANRILLLERRKCPRTAKVRLDKLLYATYLGGSSEETAVGLTVDNLGYVHLSGYSQSNNMTVSPEAFHPFKGVSDSVYAKFPPEGGQPVFVTYLGGLSNDYGMGMAVDPNGTVWQAGQTKSFDFYSIAKNAMQDGLRGDYDWYLMKLEAASTGDGSIRVSSVANAASYEAGKVSPGEIVTVFGEGLGPNEVKMASVQADGRLPMETDGVRVSFDSIPGRIIYVSRGQMAVIVPYGIQGRERTVMTVTRNGRTSVPFTLSVSEAIPGLFTADGSGRGPAAMLNQDGTLNSGENPAEGGSVVVFYGTGEGQTTPTGEDGKPAPADAAALPRPVLQPEVTIGGIPATVHYAGAVPFVTAGEFQINVEVPRGLTPGNHEVVVKFGAYASPTGVTITTK